VNSSPVCLHLISRRVRPEEFLGDLNPERMILLVVAETTEIPLFWDEYQRAKR
jgi:hypothetical protein